MNNGGGAAPTGCYKCGRPGHWSRDCPSDAKTSNPPNDNNNPTISSRPPINPTTRSSPLKPKQKPPRKTRPKLTPDLLLSDTTGIGYILRYFPQSFKCRGRGREVNDLQHLLCLYAEWHSRLLPYYDFSQFIQKVEQVGATKRVKVALRGLRERVTDGVDITKLQEPLVQQNLVDEDAPEGGLDMPVDFQENDLPNEDTNNTFHEDIWEKATQETSERAAVAVESDNAVMMSEEQKSRMEANKLKALERAAARKSRSLPAATSS
ncbi:hypothetical protein CASFOL_004200 [Castilleja foliolosa]|uniref:CCHC-type domain-containing protein n=1 Tax=Castilleja foliolosa TaxID=1961234 RepID=A0ABD3EA27_9LAMI